VALRYEQGLSFEDVAAKLGRSAVASRQLMTRVRIALKSCIERRLGET
jgi:DNA-directed RNA polymerase specialized sigma24 family protein